MKLSSYSILLFCDADTGNGRPSKDTPYGYFDGYDFIRQSKIVELKSFKNDERFSEVTTKDMSDKTIRLTYFSTFLVLEVLNAEFDKEFFVLVPEQPDENEMLSQMMGSLYMTNLSLFSDNSETIDFMLCMKFSVMLSKIYSPVEKSFWQKIFG